MSMIKGIHHVCLKTKTQEEYDRMYAFYHDLLELPVWIKAEDAILFDTGAGMIEVFTNGEKEMPQGAIYHFALLVDAENLDVMIEKVRNAGYPVVMEPTNVNIPCEPTVPVRCGFVKGPLGEEIEFFAMR